MNLPNASKAIISSTKLVDYLLSPTHPIGRFKAKFFEGLGFTQDDGVAIEGALRKLLSADAELMEATEFGAKYVVSGTIIGPNQREANIVTVWIILEGETVPRFVTAYPGDE